MLGEPWVISKSYCLFTIKVVALTAGEMMYYLIPILTSSFLIHKIKS